MFNPRPYQERGSYLVPKLIEYAVQRVTPTTEEGQIHLILGGWVYVEYAYNLDGDHGVIAGVATCFVPDGMAPHVRGEPPTTEAPA